MYERHPLYCTGKTRYSNTLGFALEKLTNDICIVIIHRFWSKFYFLNPRDTWTDENYLQYALKCMKEQNIKEPKGD